jgi:hypothetical protein
MEMAVRSMETVETVIETDGDGSGCTSPSWQGARTETSVSQNLSSMAAALWNCSQKNADCFRVWTSGSFKKAERRCQRATRGVSPPLGVARRGGMPPHGEAALWPPSGSLSVHVLHPGKIGVSVFGLSNSQNISVVAFLKHKNSRKQGSGIVASCQ